MFGCSSDLGLIQYCKIDHSHNYLIMSNCIFVLYSNSKYFPPHMLAHCLSMRNINNSGQIQFLKLSKNFRYIHHLKPSINRLGSSPKAKMSKLGGIFNIYTDSASNVLSLEKVLRKDNACASVKEGWSAQEMSSLTTVKRVIKRCLLVCWRKKY